ncbi:hypothetical protein LEMLEM_LOCUS25544 [Lemmus lemmus]
MTVCALEAAFKRLGMTVYALDSSIQGAAEQEDEFEDRPGHITRSCLKTQK